MVYPIQVQVFVSNFLQDILGVYWPEKVSNIDLSKLCGEIPIDQQIERHKWNWIGHTLRRDSDHIPRQALEWNPQGKRRRGHPKQTWRRTVTVEVKAVGMTWREVKREVQDRSGWRRTVDTLCPLLGI
ncbi:uncharacterized protein [Battus philenor]|uniref:uncharacterized protein n=1 Tax=Battus philenor TaxID=42288 RepID=UPI0035CF5E4D